MSGSGGVPSARRAAYNSLLRCEGQGRYLSLELDSTLSAHPLPAAERALYTTLLYGVTERLTTLDYLIDRYSRRPSAKLDREVVWAVRLGLYQLLYLDRIPPSAACDESVELVKRHAKSAAPFVNALLRRAAREKAAGALPFPPDDGSDLSLGVKFGFPPALVAAWRRMYGKEDALRILRGMSTPPPLTLHANTLRVSRDELIGRFRAGGRDAVAAEGVPAGVVLTGNAAVSGLDELAQGLCFVQDAASQTAVAALGAKPGETVLDLCAAPGGKSFAAALAMENRGRILSRDLHENKLGLLRDGAARLGISIITASVRDATIPDPDLADICDRVICDAPCSGTGVCAKKPELRHRAPSPELPALQYSVLSSAAAALREGGTLLYSTCTLNRDENEAVARRFASEHPDFAPLDGDGVTLFPVSADDDPARARDGFFYARFVRNGGRPPR